MTNESAVAWRGDHPGLELRLDYDYDFRPLGFPGSGWTPVASALPFLDLLPAGVSTLAKLRVRAPDQEGSISLRPFVTQAGHRFTGRAVTHEVEVAGSASGASKPLAYAASRRAIRGPRPAWARRLARSRLISSAVKKVLSFGRKRVRVVDDKDRADRS